MSQEDNLGKIRTIFVLAVLVIAAFFSRFYIFLKPQNRSIDEIVYYNLGWQLTQNLGDYNSIPVARYLIEERKRTLPPYFTQPLFKHPPAYSLLIAGAIRLFGDDYAAAEVVSLGTAVLLIPLIFLLGNFLFDRRVGMLSAFFLFIDPINIMTSQKIWMDMPLAFFTFLSLCLYVCGIRFKSLFYFVLSGVCAGLATLTKYPGILAVFIQMVYSAIFYPKLYRKRVYVASLIIPVIMLLPWFYWNYHVYGLSFLQKQIMLHDFFVHYRLAIRIIVFIIFAAVLTLLNLVTSIRQRILATLGEFVHIFQQRRIRVALAVLFYSLFLTNISANLNFLNMPKTSWANILFSHEGWGFYFGRLMEYSLIYAFAFLAFFLRFREKTEEISFLKVSSLVLLVFYGIYRNFQCRYIAAALPFLVILGCFTLSELWDYFSDHPNLNVRHGGRIAMIAAITFIVCKTILINYFVSFTNDMCYF